MNRNNWAQWVMGFAIALGVIGVPIVYYRMTYTHQKRLRVVTANKVYRSGCMSASGLEEALQKYHVRTVINLMEEAPDPELPPHYFAKPRVKESELCRRNKVRYVNLVVECLPENRASSDRPATIERFLEIMDEPANYPVLIHCKAGLHRTGVMVGVYRMEYEGWTNEQALAELRRNGFGHFASTSANAYIRQYILDYHPHLRPGLAGERLPMTPGNLVSRPGQQAPNAFAPLPKPPEPQ